MGGGADIVEYRVVSDAGGRACQSAEDAAAEAEAMGWAAVEKAWAGNGDPVDMVNAPPHYTDGGIEAIDYLRAKLTPEEFRGFCKGNALKYLSRAGKKGDATEDYAKSAWYLARLTGV